MLENLRNKPGFLGLLRVVINTERSSSTLTENQHSLNSKPSNNMEGRCTYHYLSNVAMTDSGESLELQILFLLVIHQ